MCIILCLESISRGLMRFHKITWCGALYLNFPLPEGEGIKIKIPASKLRGINLLVSFAAFLPSLAKLFLTRTPLPRHPLSGRLPGKASPGCFSISGFTLRGKPALNGDQRGVLDSPLETPSPVGSRGKPRGICCANKIARKCYILSAQLLSCLFILFHSLFYRYQKH